jgi:predicted transcriptional regulator
MLNLKKVIVVMMLYLKKKLVMIYQSAQMKAVLGELGVHLVHVLENVMELEQEHENVDVKMNQITCQILKGAEIQKILKKEKVAEMKTVIVLDPMENVKKTVKEKIVMMTVIVKKKTVLKSAIVTKM